LACLAILVGATGSLILLGFVAARTTHGALLDQAAGDAVLNAVPSALGEWLGDASRSTVIIVLVPLAALLGILTLLRLDWRRLLAGLVIGSGPGALALALRIRDPLRLPTEGFPSDHAALALGLVLAIAILWPTPLNRMGWITTALIAMSIALGNVTSHAHTPADVVGSSLLVVGVAAATLTVLGPRAANTRR
jgi:membrane-associated phospholipid phosphatase